jgi:hypothetical protein
MAFHQAGLSELLLASFARACLERRLQVAEHLLVALEELAEEEFRKGEAEAGHCLVEAYAIVADKSRGLRAEEI